jgi:hypothetical protein
MQDENEREAQGQTNLVFKKKTQQSNKNSIDNRLMMQDLTNKYWETIQKSS